MDKKINAVIGVVAGAGLLAMPGVAAATPLLQDAASSNMVAEAAAVSLDGLTPMQDDARGVVGEFSFTQDQTTDTRIISNVFQVAASALCSSLPEYGVIETPLTVSGTETFTATVGEMMEEEGVASFVMGCACASNPAGGGAIINAKVSGVSLSSLAALAGVA